MSRSGDNIVISEWQYFLAFLRREMKPVFIFMPILITTTFNVAATIFFYIETVALTSSSKSIYIAAIIYTVAVGVALALQFLAEYLTPHIRSKPVYDSTSIENTIDVWSYRGAILFQWLFCSFFLWADVVFQEHQCGSDENLCLSDSYVPLHRVIMFICTIVTFNSIVFASQTWYGYARPNYAPLILALRVYDQYLLDEAYNAPSRTETIAAPPQKQFSQSKKRRAV